MYSHMTSLRRENVCWRGFPNGDALCAALDAGFGPASVAARVASSKKAPTNGFNFARQETPADLAICNEEGGGQ
jgi:hypothetical protein